MANETSCVGCKYLYAKDEGYSNYTVTDTEIRCALTRNPKLPSYKPWDWDKANDKWEPTATGRCDFNQVAQEGVGE